MKSIRDLYKVGKGPSSSHTMGPERAARIFKQENPGAERYEVTLYGSLALTGVGHGTDRVLSEVLAPTPTEIIFSKKDPGDLRHPNTLDFAAYKGEEKLASMRVESIGGGDIVIEGREAAEPDDVYPENSFAEIAQYCRWRYISLREYVELNEGPEIWAFLLDVWQTMKQSIDETCESFLSGETADDWDFAALRRHYLNWLCLPTDFNYTTEQLGDLTKEGIADELYKRGMDILTAKEKRYGAKTMRELERICLLRNVDSKWMEHIDNMDQLKQGMGLRGYGQHDPVVEYRIEGFAMFDEMIASIREDAVHMLLTIEIRQQNAEPKREQIAKPTGDNAPGDTGAKAPAPVRVTKIGRNDPCPCGSGLKWKKCTCKEYHPDL